MASAPFTRAKLAAVAAAIAVSILAPDVSAQDAKDLARARERFKEAAALQAAGDWARALEAYKDVALVKSSAQVRFNIASCEEKLGDYLRAAGSYRLALTEATRSNSKDIEKAVQKALTDLEPRIPTLLVRRGQGATVAEVILDGRPLGNPSIGVEFQVNPGPHDIRAMAPDREAMTIEITLADREHRVIDIVLKPHLSAAQTTNKPGPVAVAPKPVAPPPPPLGNKPLRIAGFVTGGLGVAGLGVSAAFFALKQKAISDLDAQCGATRMACPASAASTRDAGKRDDLIATATFGAGLGALVLGTTLAIVSTRVRASKPSTGFVLGPGGGAITGSF